MPFHTHTRQVGQRLLITLGITAGNIARLRKGPIPFAAGKRDCVLRLDHHPLPIHPGWFAVTMSDRDVAQMIEEGMVEYAGTNVGVVCVFGRTPALAWAALRRAVGDA